jgi:hypothetical protein
VGDRNVQHGIGDGARFKGEPFQDRLNIAPRVVVDLRPMKAPAAGVGGGSEAAHQVGRNTGTLSWTVDASSMSWQGDSPASSRRNHSTAAPPFASLRVS